jgi:hypothetical protein
MTPEAADAVVAAVVAEVQADPGSVGLLLHGSRAAGTARPDSDYDLIRIVTDAEREARGRAGTLIERRPENGVDLLYQSPGRLDWVADHPDWYTATYFGARVLVDKTGEVAAGVRRIRTVADERAAESVDDYYDDYLVAFVRSLKCWRRGEVLGARLNAAESARRLVRTLFAFARRWAPYPDALAVELPDLVATLGWAGDPLPIVLDRLLRDPHPAYQQQVERQVAEVADRRGHHYEHQDDVAPARGWRFEPVPAGYSAMSVGDGPNT